MPNLILVMINALEGRDGKIAGAKWLVCDHIMILSWLKAWKEGDLDA